VRLGVGVVRRRRRIEKPKSICQVCERNRGRKGCPKATKAKRKCEEFIPVWDDEVT
jgi:hypothetical protein